MNHKFQELDIRGNTNAIPQEPEGIWDEKLAAYYYSAPAGDTSLLIRYMLFRTFPLVFIVGFIGVYLVWYIPLIISAIITVLSLGCLYGEILLRSLGKAYCRRKYVVLGSLILTIAFGWWCNWVIWADLYLNQYRQVRIDIPLIPIYNLNFSKTDPVQLLYLLTHPGKMLDFLDVTYNNGLFSIFSRSSTGSESWFAWLLELAGIFWVALLKVSKLYEVPFSTAKGTYYEKMEMVIGYVEDTEAFKQRLESGDFGPLRMAIAGNKGGSHALLRLYLSEGDTAYVSLLNKKVKVGKFWNSTEDEPLVKHLGIDRETVDSLQRLSANNDPKSSVDNENETGLSDVNVN
jgi:hypothetical protein